MDRSHRERQEALLSVYAHAFRDATKVPSRGRAAPMGIERAIEVIDDDRGEHSAQRQQIIRVRAKRLDAPQAAPSRAAARVAAVGVPAAKAPCKFEAGELVPDFDLPTRTLVYTTQSRVNRPLSELRAVLDPRAWGQCSDFFDPERTYRCKVANGAAVVDKHGEHVRDDGPEPLGDSWSGLLRERFDGPGIAVNTILTIDFIASPDKVSVYYALYLSDRCVLGPFTDIGGVRMNTGRAIATETDDGNGRKSTTVKIDKSLRFVDFTPGDAGSWLDFGDALSIMMVLMGVMIDDKFVLKLCCDPKLG